MPGGAVINTNIPAMNAYNTLIKVSNQIANHQLRLSTGKRINSAADDVAGYITSRSLQSRNGALKASLNAVGEAKNVTSMTQDALDNISGLLNQIKDAASNASSGSLGTEEKVALAKSAYRLAEQIQLVTDSTVFGGKQLLAGAFDGDWTVGYDHENALKTLNIDLTSASSEFNITGDFMLTATDASHDVFAGVSNLDLTALNAVTSSDLGVFSTDNISTTLTSLSDAITNISKVASYVGGVQVRLDSQEELLQSQITNYKSAISRIEDADVATEQMDLIKAQFLQQASLISLTQANQTPQTYLQLFR